MFENITEVIGFDLGHGETGLTRLRLDDLDKHSQPEPIEIYKKKNHITAIGYHPTKGTLIGESALRTPGVTESHITFKRRPNSDPIYQRVMHDFIKTIYDHLVEQGKIEEDKTLFIVGCPSEWSKDEAVVQAYEQIFSQAGIPNGTVVPESRAALMHAEESGMFKVAELKGSVLVIDVGSSTTDFTLVDLKDKKSIATDDGRDLGAALIDKAIFQWTLNKHPNQDELKKIFEDHLYIHIRNGCELTCRRAKQEYFSAPELYQEAGDYVPGGGESIQGRYLFIPQIDGTVMSEILNSQIVKLDGELKTWPDAFENELKKVRQKFSPEVILLTGGASRMDFVPEICKKIFPQVSVKSDDTPEFCIAKGLARWGRVDIWTSKFMEEVKQTLDEKLGETIVSRRPALIDKLSEILADGIIKKVIKPNLRFWRKYTNCTINDIERYIKREAGEWLESSDSKDKMTVQIIKWAQEIQKTVDKIIDPICTKYNLPSGTMRISAINLGKSRGGLTDNPFEGDPTALTESIQALVGYIIYFVGLGITGALAMTGIGTIFGIILSIISAIIGVGAVEEWMKDRKIPICLRKWSLSDSKIKEKMTEIRPELIQKMKAILSENKELMDNLRYGVSDPIRKAVLEKAESARLLIS